MRTIELTLKADYIMEDAELSKRLMEIFEDEQNRVIILNAPQGTGKSKLINELEHVYFSPTKLLVEQQYNEFGGVLSKGTIKQFAEFIGASEDDYGDIMLDDKNQKTTFASSNTAEQSKKKWFIIDEAHKLCDFSSFANESVLNTVEQSLYHYRSGGNLLFVSATPDNFIKDFYDFYEDNGVVFNTQVKVLPSNSSKYLNTLYIVDCKSNDVFINLIREKQSLNYNSGKQIGLFSNKSMIKETTDELLGKGLNAIGLDSHNRDIPEHKGGTQEHFKKLVESKQMTHKIMNFTSFVDTGVSFEDNDISNLYFMMPAGKVNITTAMQFICRARNSKPNAYMKLEYLNDFDKTRLEMDDFVLEAMLIEYAEKQLQAYKYGMLRGGDLERVAGIVKGKKGYECSEIAVKQEVRSLYEKVMLSTFDGFKQVFKEYYNDIVFLTSDNFFNEDITLKARNFLRKYANIKIDANTKNEIVNYLCELGLQGKTLSNLTKKVGFKSEPIDHKGNYLILEE